MIRKKPFRQSVVTFVLVVAVTTGCRSNSEYKKLADAGNEYTKAVDKLLVVATDSYIEVSSNQILDSVSDIRGTDEQTQALRRISESNDNINDIPKINEVFDNINEPSQERIKLYKAIREHNKLLGEYFQVLGELAESKSSTSLQGKILGIVSNLTTTGKLISAASRAVPALARVTNSPVSSEFTGALRSELEQRKDIIMREITIQKEILKAMGELMERDAKYIYEKEEKNLRDQLIFQDISNNDEKALWIANRRSFLTMDRTAKELREASKALSNFQAVFQSFIEGKSNLDQLKNASKGLKSFSQSIK
jgi:hypothetical protein